VSNQIWMVLAIGNSRCHWAWFCHTQLQVTWDTSHLDAEIMSKIISGSILLHDRIELFPLSLHQAISDCQIEISQVPIYLCSVVPHQTAIWQQLPQVTCLTLADVPIFNLYSTLGIDRALSIFGAGEIYGYPVLVIDGGTALTITGIDRDRYLVGGAIMPGLKLQFRSLSTGTAALPEIIDLPAQLPRRWSDNTVDAIAGGILHTITSGITDFIGDWLGLFPESKTIFTGGDGEILARYCRSFLIINSSKFSTDCGDNRVLFNPNLIFYGCSTIYHNSTSSRSILS
jgi:type III pantothenate kinase